MTSALDRRIVLGFGLLQSHAVKVLSVEANSPAARAGLRMGDLIVGLDGIVIDSVDALHQALGASRINSDSVLKLLRSNKDGTPTYLTVRPSEQAAR